MADITYYINEELGTVVAKMPRFEEDFYREINELCYKQYMERYGYSFSSEMSKFCQNLMTRNLHNKYHSTYKNLFGKAQCNYAEGENFDLEKGMELAKQRLMKKVFELRANILVEVYRELLGVRDSIGDRITHYMDRLDEYKENIINLEASY